MLCIVSSPLEVLADDVECVSGPEVRDGVAALVGWSIEGVGGTRGPLIVGNGSV